MEKIFWLCMEKRSLLAGLVLLVGLFGSGCGSVTASKLVGHNHCDCGYLPDHLQPSIFEECTDNCRDSYSP